jgi:hypothetical protein
MFKQITKENWLLFAQHNYDNPTLEQEREFYEDLKRFKYLKRLFRKYVFTGDLNIRLVVNHIIVLQNVFGVEAAVTLLLYKLDFRFWPALKSVLDYLNYLYPHELQEVDADKKVLEILKGL